MRAIGVVACLACAAIGAVVACTSFSGNVDDGGEAQDGGSHGDAEPLVDGGAPDAPPPTGAGGDDATAPSPCPPDASTVFEDDFDQPSRPSLQYKWTDLTQDTNAALWIDGGSLYAQAPAQGSGETKGLMRYALSAPSKRLCVELRATVVKPTSFAAYGDGHTNLVYVTSTPSSGEGAIYHGVVLDDRGAEAFWNGIDAGRGDVLAFRPGALVVIDIDYVTGNATISADGDVHPFASSWPTAEGLPSAGFAVGVDQNGATPEAEVVYDRVRASFYQ